MHDTYDRQAEPSLAEQDAYYAEQEAREALRHTAVTAANEADEEDAGLHAPRRGWRIA